MQHDRAQGMKTARTEYRVVPSMAADAPGGIRSVVFCVDGERCPMRLQDHFTPDEADRLADALHAIATEARTLAATNAERSDSEPAATVSS